MKVINLYDTISPLKLKINLENMPLQVYRRILVPENINMMQLHFVIQISMGWEFEHLFQFSDKKYDYSIIVKIPFEDDFDDFNPFRHREILLPENVKLAETFKMLREAKPFYYCYDFGDDWYHKITFQKPIKKDLAAFKGQPILVDAAGACPPEDVGGPWGYASFLEIMNDKKHPEHDEFKEWAGLDPKEEFDEESVDIESINHSLAEYHQSAEWNLLSKDYFK